MTDVPPLSEVLIIGAGPAGLSLAFALKQQGIGSLLLERGPVAAHSWALMPAGLKLVSPWKANCLPGANSRRFPSNYEMRRAEYCSFLQEYARLKQLSVQTNCEVQKVTRHDEGFFVRTSGGTFGASLLVNATGCFTNPFTPFFPGARESSLPQVHSGSYHDAKRLRETVGKPSGLVLVVGQRLSAGQVLVELVDAGFEVALSCRHSIQFGADPIGSWIFFRLYPALERLKLALRGSAARGVEVRMPGGRARKLIEGGRVTVFSGIARFEDRRVVFTDGRSLEPDAVLYATGFRPALGHLGSLGLTLDESTGQPVLKDFESAETAGLFFLGLDNVRNFRSRFIRGIREDAAILAGELAARARSRGRRRGTKREAAPVEAVACVAPDPSRLAALPPYSAK
jgi:putative flavoprotein involved in K+ transport